MRSLVFGAALGVAAFAAPAADAVDIQEVVSPGGVTAWLVEEPSIPIVSIVIGFEGGASLDAEDAAGRARLFASLLDEGAGDLDAAAFAAAEEETALRFSVSPGRDAITVTATMLADRRDASLDLVRLALTDPRFDDDAVVRIRASQIATIRENAVNPDRIAAQRWFAAAYPDDAYGRPVAGFEETVAALDAEALRAASDLYLNRAGMTVGVVGAITADELGPVLDALLGGLPEQGPDFPEAVAPASLSGVEVVDFPAPQSTVLFGHVGVARDDPDFIPAFILNHVLGGGGFESRLMTEIREKEGLAYSVYSYLSPLDRSALYLGGLGTRNDAVARSIELVRREWSRIADEGLPEADLERAKTYLTGAYPLRFDSNAKIARFLVGAQQEDLGLDYINIRNDLVRAVTTEDIARVAQRLMRPEELFFVVVGQPENL